MQDSSCRATVRRAPVVAVVAAVAVLAGCGGGHSAAPPTVRSSSSTSSATASSTATSAAPTPTPVSTPSEPGGSARLLPGNRIVAFYGAAGTPALGVLGTASAAAIWPRLAQQAAAYRTAGAPVIPAYELIADVIQGSPGTDGDYEVQEPGSVLTSYLQAAHAHHALLILDIQPGRTSFLPLAERLAPYLADPDVGLALDPEWRLTPGQVPDQQIGTVSATEVNRTSAWLAAFTAAHHLPQKLLLIHQFTTDEIVGKAGVVPRAQLATVFNMDGFGSRAAKLSKYRFLAQDLRFGLGLKLFYKQDVDIYSPPEALAIRPAPVVIDYE